MTTSEILVKRVATYVKSKLWGEPTGHDWYHAQRVLRMARILQREEGGNLSVIELAALVHDLGDYKKHDYNEYKGNLVLDAMMDILEINRDTQRRIMRIVSESQYKGSETKVPSTIEGKIIQDADWLETVGAIGIARGFATGGQIGRMMYDPDIKPRTGLNKLDYQKKKYEGTSLNYFFEKSLRLSEMMNTKTGKKIAKRRSEFLLSFIDEFIAEWNGIR
ncbi:MAG: HD domain-containing protein [bacterium]